MSWAVWLTGPPAAGKTSVARAFLELARKEGIRAIHLESDELRRILTPAPTYEPAERDRFYAQVAALAALLVGQGFPVVIDATAPRRAHREKARELIGRFLEIHVDAPAALREERDPKGLYRKAREGLAPHLPGATEAYEDPVRPDLRLDGTRPAEEGAEALLARVRAAFMRDEPAI